MSLTYREYFKDLRRELEGDGDADCARDLAGLELLLDPGVDHAARQSAARELRDATSIPDPVLSSFCDDIAETGVAGMDLVLDATIDVELLEAGAQQDGDLATGAAQLRPLEYDAESQRDLYPEF